MVVENPGRLNKVAKLQRLNKDKKNENGFATKETWETIKTFRCNIVTEENKSIRTLNKYGVTDNLDYKIITARYFEDIRHSDRIVLNGKTFDIEVINNIEEANKELRIWVRGNNV